MWLHGPLLLTLGSAAILAQQPAIEPANVALGKRLRAVVAPLYPPDEPGAVVVVLRGGELLLHEAYGMAELEQGVTMTKDTVFRAASIGKLFTATVALRLAEEERLDLDASVDALLGDVELSAAVTVRHLLTHTSGIPEFLAGEDLREWIRVERTLDELVRELPLEALDFAPGTASAYSNSNYVLLAKLATEVSDTSWPRLLAERVFEPAGMVSSECEDERRLVPKRAAGYQHASLEPEEEREGAARFQNELFYSPTVLTGCGRVLSTAEDLGRFLRAFFGGQLLERKSVKTSVRAARLADGRRTGFGMGWELHRVGRRRAVMKGGALSGFTHYVLAVPDEELFVVLLTNRAAEEERRPGRLCLELAERALDGEQER